jgi:hypothetical protein
LPPSHNSNYLENNASAHYELKNGSDSFSKKTSKNAKKNTPNWGVFYE